MTQRSSTALTVNTPSRVNGILPFLRYLANAKLAELRSLPQADEYKLEPVQPFEMIVGELSPDLQRVHLIAGNLAHGMEQKSKEIEEADLKYRGLVADGQMSLDAKVEYDKARAAALGEYTDLTMKYHLAMQTFETGMNLEFATQVASLGGGGGERQVKVREGYKLVLVREQRRSVRVVFAGGGADSFFRGGGLGDLGEFEDLLGGLGGLGGLFGDLSREHPLSRRY